MSGAPFEAGVSAFPPSQLGGPPADAPAPVSGPRILTVEERATARAMREAGATWTSIGAHFGMRDNNVRAQALATPQKLNDWTPEMDARLLKLRADGLSIEECARQLGLHRSNVGKRHAKLKGYRNNKAAAAAAAKARKERETPRVCLGCKSLFPSQPKKWTFRHADPPSVRRICDPCRARIGQYA